MKTIAVLLAVAAMMCHHSSLLAQHLSPAQIQQIERIAEDIAKRHNARSTGLLDDVTISTWATSRGRNVRFQNVLRIKPGTSRSKLDEFERLNRQQTIGRACTVNGNNPAFDRGLSYTFAYYNQTGVLLHEFTVDKQTCQAQ